ncbi:bifunctional alpha/beta hydrolase/OsmC family protein [Telluribacter sp. SYSU D00476]|uniref:bifunctional alpha/beta hydrolase/OsmC family protein n=1 Tax=Telluribacter sp. SYSU D00476 TaxID=2811430 RepID=UPI001FF53F0B|nr:bifunctional alpha/beta hydrolase/OsmC family protein [Telluribacter sp. SYSU D00476]
MKSVKLSIKNKAGEPLSARLELPASRRPHSYAIFAHCFTCSKDLNAVRNICLALTNRDFAVVRFDFTGLGESGGDFSDTNFSHNIDDLMIVGEYLEKNYKAPTLLIGHSLGGAAAIVAGSKMASIRAVATIGAPSTISHVTHLFKEDLSTIEAEGYAEVSIGGRPFTIRKHFIDSLELKDLSSIVKNMRKPLLIAHSPQDRIVDIRNAGELYKAARHPKSFLSLDRADHLLSDEEDSHYVGDVLSSWAKRYIDFKPVERADSDSQVVAQIAGDDYTTQIQTRQHTLIADEPVSLGGNDLGPSPYELLSAGLGACTAITLKMYANRKKWDLQEVLVHLDHGKVHAEDSAHTEVNQTQKIDQFTRNIELVGNLDDTQRARLLEIANKCPVHKTLHNNIVIKTTLRK